MLQLQVGVGSVLAQAQWSEQQIPETVSRKNLLKMRLLIVLHILSHKIYLFVFLIIFSKIQKILNLNFFLVKQVEAVASG